MDKILGPGNQYVTAAKMLLQNSEAMISMDMPAGPSEVRMPQPGMAQHARGRIYFPLLVLDVRQQDFIHGDIRGCNRPRHIRFHSLLLPLLCRSW